MRYVFDNSQVDWRERLGYLLLTPHYYAKGYYKVDGIDKQEIAKTNSVALQILSYLFQTLQIKKLGKYLIRSSDTFKAKLKIINQPNVNRANPLYYTAAERWAFLDSALTVYAEAIKSDEPAWATPQASKFLRDELRRIKADTQALIAETNQSILDAPADQGLSDLKDRLQELDLAVVDYLKGYKNISSLDQTAEIIGLQNVGNTCYINAAVQPLLAVKDFSDLVPALIRRKKDEGMHDFDRRRYILDSFKAFIEAYKAKKSPRDLGLLIGELRTHIFRAGLYQGGFINPSQEASMQDVGSFLELILHVIGQGFELIHTKNFKVPNNQPDHQVSETLPQGTLLLKEKNGSIQDKINSLAQVREDVLDKDDVLKTEIQGMQYKLSEFTETFRLKHAPDLLVFRVEGYQVKTETDRILDCTPLLESQPNIPVQYELAGFAQNKNHVHWTSVVSQNGKWTYCDDDRVRSTNPEDPAFLFPAHYLIYRKK